MKTTPVLCAVLCWSGAALRLKDRDDWINWDPLTRGNTLLAVIPFEEFDSLNDAFDYYRDHRGKSLKFIKAVPPFPEGSSQVNALNTRIKDDNPRFYRLRVDLHQIS